MHLLLSLLVSSMSAGLSQTEMVSFCRIKILNHDSPTKRTDRVLPFQRVITKATSLLQQGSSEQRSRDPKMETLCGAGSVESVT